MKNYSRFEEIRNVVLNDSKPVKEQDRTTRSLNDSDIDWLIQRVQKLENTLKLLIDIPRNRLTTDNLLYLVRDGLKE